MRKPGVCVGVSVRCVTLVCVCGLETLPKAYLWRLHVKLTFWRLFSPQSWNQLHSKWIYLNFYIYIFASLTFDVVKMGTFGIRVQICDYIIYLSLIMNAENLVFWFMKSSFRLVTMSMQIFCFWCHFCGVQWKTNVQHSTFVLLSFKLYICWRLRSLDDEFSWFHTNKNSNFCDVELLVILNLGKVAFQK